MVGAGAERGRELRPALRHIAAGAVSLTGARYAVLTVLDLEHGLVGEVFTVGLCPAERDRIAQPPCGPDRFGERLRTALGTRTGSGAPGRARAFLGVPVRVRSEVLGHLYAAHGPDRAFTDQDLALLGVLAAQAGTAIGNARLYESARRRQHWIEGAAAVTAALLSGSSADDALTTVADRARVLAGAAAGVVLQPTAEGGMEIVAAAGLDDPDGVVGTTIRPGSPVLAELLGGRPVFIEDSATDPRMTTPVRNRFGPSMMLPLQSGGRLIGTLALPRDRHGRPYSAVERLLATQFASHAALALVLADAQADRERLAVYEDRDRIARDLHDLVVQRLFATEMMLESTRRRADDPDADKLLEQAVDELDSTIQEVRTAILALQQPPAEAPATVRGRVLRETHGAAVPLGFTPSVRFTGAVDALVPAALEEPLLSALRTALDAARHRAEVAEITVEVDVTAVLGDGGGGGEDAVRLRVHDDGRRADGGRGTTFVWEAAR
ncbi:GAF domain-containing protein [Streptomyces sp. NPDC005805]|uniref:GAF domain-containing protein n=1 Tax=Streptomyces sp. NPDC005805 TaxID=3157068 RepID=UPI0033FC17DB